MSIERIKFLFPNIDQSISNFESLAREANYTIGNNKTYNLVLLQLKPMFFEKW